MDGVSSGREIGDVGPLDNLRFGDCGGSSSTAGESTLIASIDIRYAMSVF